MTYKEILQDRADVTQYDDDNMLILCPFHSDSNPSCSVHIKTGGFQCWSCGETGTFTQLLAQLDNITEEQAKEVLQQDFSASRVLESIQNSLGNLSYTASKRLRSFNQDFFFSWFPELNKDSLNYLYSRGIKDSIIQLFNLRQGEDADLDLSKRKNKKWKDRIIFPFYDLENRIVGFGGRTIHKGTKPKVKKCIAYKGAGKSFLFGLNHLYKGKKLSYLILGESDIDTLYLQQFGFNAVAAWAVGKLSDEQIYLIMHTTNLLILNYNNRYIDEAGRKATERESVRMKQYLPTIVCDFPKGKKDANELSVKEVKRLYLPLLRRCKINTKGVIL